MLNDSPQAEPLPKGERRRLALLGALEDLLKQTPLADIQVAHITAEAGLVRSAFYFYFPTKHAAVAELMHHVYEEMLVAAGAFIAGGDGAQATFRSGFEDLVGIWERHAKLIAAMLDARDADPEAAAIWSTWIDSFIPPLVEAVERERSRRSPRADTIPAEMVVRMLVLMNGAMLERHVRQMEPRYSAETLAHGMAEIWIGVIFQAD